MQGGQVFPLQIPSILMFQARFNPKTPCRRPVNSLECCFASFHDRFAPRTMIPLEMVRGGRVDLYSRSVNNGCLIFSRLDVIVSSCVDFSQDRWCSHHDFMVQILRSLVPLSAKIPIAEASNYRSFIQYSFPESPIVPTAWPFSPLYSAKLKGGTSTPSSLVF